MLPVPNSKPKPKPKPKEMHVKDPGIQVSRYRKHLPKQRKKPPETPERCAPALSS